MKLQGNGAYLGDYFAFFKSIYGDGSSVASGNRMALTPGAALMAAFIAAIALWVHRRETPAMRLVTVWSVCMLWMASNLFPWNGLAAHSTIGRLLSQIQFPWRYLGMASLLLAILLGQVQESTRAEERRNWRMAALALCLCVPLGFVSSYCDGLGVQVDAYNAYDTAELDTSTMTAVEYLRVGADADELSTDLQAENLLRAELISRSGSQIRASCRTGEVGGTLEVPMFHYKGYRAVDEAGRDYEITDGTNQVIRISLPAHFDGQLTVEFIEPWYWRAAEIISLLSWIALFALALRGRRERRRLTV